MLHERRRNVRATALRVSEETYGGSTDAWKPSGIYRDRECPRFWVYRRSLFLRWRKLFVDTVGCTKENRHLLLLDSHESHKSFEVIIFARDNGVVMLTFPPHCTHRLQPLDRISFRSLKAGHSRACDNWMTCHKGRPITQFDVIEQFTTAYNTSATVASATNGFSAAGYGRSMTRSLTTNWGTPTKRHSSRQSAILSEMQMTCRQNRSSTMSSRDQSLVHCVLCSIAPVPWQGQLQCLAWHW